MHQTFFPADDNLHLWPGLHNSDGPIGLNTPFHILCTAKRVFHRCSCLGNVGEELGAEAFITQQPAFMF